MAWQEDHAGWDYIAANAVLRPIARAETVMAPNGGLE